MASLRAEVKSVPLDIQFGQTAVDYARYRVGFPPAFFDRRNGKARFPYVDALLAPSAIRANGLFNPDAVARLVTKAKSLPLGTAEGMAFSRSELDDLLDLAEAGITQIFALQRELLEVPPPPRRS